MEQHIKAYLEFLRLKNYALTTLYNYTNFLRDFELFLISRRCKNINAVKPEILEDYARSLYRKKKKDGRNISVSHQRSLLLVIRGFFCWLVKTGKLLQNPARDIVLPKTVFLIKDILTKEEVKRILAEPAITGEPNYLPLRDKAILEILYSTGIRNFELCELRLNDIDPEKELLLVRKGKGMKQRLVPIGKAAMRWLSQYQEEARMHFLVKGQSDYLFLTFKGTPFTKTSLTILVRNYIRAAGVVKNGSCHLFRHSCATHMLEGGCDIRYIQEMLGHVELTTTQIYTRVNPVSLRDVYSRSFRYGA